MGKRYYTKCTKSMCNFCEVCAHFLVDTWYYIHRKNPPIHYIIFATPHSKNTFSKKDDRAKGRLFFTLQEIAFLQSKKRSARMRTAAYKVDAASDRCRRENVPRHILCYASNEEK